VKLFIIGPPGSGKGTQAEMIAKEFNLKHIGIGDILRKKVLEKSKDGKVIKDHMDRGDLVPNYIVDKIVNDKTKDVDKFIVDGFPRDIKQAEGFKGKVDKIIYLTSSDEVIIKRLLLRKRVDDTLEIIKHRIRVYNEDTEPVIKFYKKKKLLLEINGNPTIEEVFIDLKNTLKKIFFSKNS